MNERMIELLSSIDELDKLISESSFYIFGAGKVSRTVISHLCPDKNGLLGVVVSDKNGNPDHIFGYKVMGLSEIQAEEKTKRLIVCVGENFLAELQDGLARMWDGDIFFVSGFLYNELIKRSGDFSVESINAIDDLKKTVLSTKYNLLKHVSKPCFPYMVVNICDHCNLRCKGCDHFACIADPYFVAYETICRDMDRMAELFHGDYILKIAVMGGEPLLHPDLLKIMKKIRESFPFAQIRLTTNGILLLNQSEEFWETCRDNRITIVNTKYPIKIDHEALKKMSEEKGVCFMHYEGTGGTSVRKLQKHVIDPAGRSDPVFRFTDCHVANYGNFLMEGKLYGCPFSCQAYRIFEKKFPQGLRMTEKDYLDIYKVKDMQEMLDFAARPKFFCRYCGSRSSDYDWAPSKRQASEWLEEED